MARKFSTTIIFCCYSLFIVAFYGASVDASQLQQQIRGAGAGVESAPSRPTKEGEGDGGGFMPKFSSRPPTPLALSYTPEQFRDDDVIESMKQADQAGNCTVESYSEDTMYSYCHITFPPPQTDDEEDAKVGVILYPGGLVDPRSYSVIAKLLSEQYGFVTVIPVFYDDIALDVMPPFTCSSGRLELAELEFPSVEKWVLAGHSLGGVAAASDLWAAITNVETKDTTKAGGLALLASYISEDGVPACGNNVDFSSTGIPMASVTGSEDQVLPWEDWYDSQHLLSNHTQWTDIYGGVHEQFGSYIVSDDDEDKETLLISPEVVWEFVGASIASVASRMMKVEQNYTNYY